jgi:hypothetical protein
VGEQFFTWTIKLNRWALLVSLCWNAVELPRDVLEGLPGWRVAVGAAVSTQSSAAAKAAVLSSIRFKLASSACSTLGLKSFKSTGQSAKPRASNKEQ